MSDKFRKKICEFLAVLEEIAAETQSQIDDFVVKSLQKIFGCKEE